MLTAARRLLTDESAQGLVEYALLTFTALVCIAALRYLGGKANNSLTNAGNGSVAIRCSALSSRLVC
jgi:Flp pilus assembly pilin Flp